MYAIAMLYRSEGTRVRVFRKRQERVNGRNTPRNGENGTLHGAVYTEPVRHALSFSALPSAPPSAIVGGRRGESNDEV